MYFHLQLQYPGWPTLSALFAALVQDYKHQVIQKEHVLLILPLILNRSWTDFERAWLTHTDPAQNNSFLTEK